MNIIIIFSIFQENRLNTCAKLYYNIWGIEGVESGNKKTRIKADDAIFTDISLDGGIIFAKFVRNRTYRKSVWCFSFTDD